MGAEGSDGEVGYSAPADIEAEGPEVSCHYLTSKRWDAFPPGMSCPGCRDKKGLVPVADFS